MFSIRDRPAIQETPPSPPWCSGTISHKPTRLLANAMAAARAVPPMLLVQVVADLYQAGEVVLCRESEEAETDSFDSEVVAKLSTEAEFLVSVSGRQNVSAGAFGAWGGAQRRTLFVGCECGDCSSSWPKLLMPEFVWLSFDKTIPEKLPLRLDSNYLTYEAGANGSWILYENYKVKRGILQRAAVSTWTKKYGVKMRRKELWERRSDLGGTTLTNVMLPFTTWNIIMNDSAPLNGLMPNVLDALAMSLNFSVEWMRPDDGSFGSELESGTWTGIIGDLVNVSADLSSAGLVVTEKRKKVIDFSLTVVEDKFQLYRLSSQKQASHLNVLAFLKIFNVKVWAAALFTTLLIATVAFLSERQIVNENNIVAFSPYLLGVWFPTDGSTNTTDVQGHTKKVLFLCAGLMTYFLVTSYSVDLIAHMTAGSSMDIRDCLDLKKSNAKLFSDEGTVVSDLLQDGLLKNCKQFSTLLDSSCDLSCKVQIFEKEGSSSMAVYYAPELFDSRLSNIPGFPSPAAPVAFAFPKDSELTALFDHHLLKLIQNGVINRVYYHWIASYRERYSSGSSSSATSEVTALSMDQLFFPMLIIGSGMALAVVVSVLEKLYSSPKMEVIGGN